MLPGLIALVMLAAAALVGLASTPVAGVTRR
jgi:hypothetical protein